MAVRRQLLVASLGFFSLLGLPGRVAAAPCVGDCQGSGTVSVVELIIGTNIALELRPVATCPSFDVDGNDMVQVNELILAVRSALEGCEPAATATAAATDTPTFAPTGTAPTVILPSATPTTPGTPVGTATSVIPATETPTEAPTGTAAATLSATPTGTPTGTAAATVSATPTGTPTGTAAATVSATPTGTAPTVTPETPAEATLTLTPDSATPTAVPDTPVETVTTATPPTATETPTDTPGTPAGTATAVTTQTPTPTPEATAQVGTPTSTPDIFPVAGSAAVVGHAASGIANVIAAVVTGLTGGGGGAALSGVDVDLCPLGGMVETDGSLLSNLTLTLTDCVVAKGSGTATYNGSIVVSDVAILGLTQLEATATFAATIVFTNFMDVTTLTVEANLEADVVLTAAAAPGQSCTFELPVLGASRLAQLSMALVGRIDSTAVDGASGLEFENTGAVMTINQYGVACVPSDYGLVLNGKARASSESIGPFLSGGSPPASIDLHFLDLTLAADGDTSTLDLEINGSIAACLGGSVVLSTMPKLQFVVGEFCPVNGGLAVAGLGEVSYSNGAVSVDDLNPETSPLEIDSCLDVRLLACLE